MYYGGDRFVENLQSNFSVKWRLETLKEDDVGISLLVSHILN